MNLKVMQSLTLECLAGGLRAPYHLNLRLHHHSHSHPEQPGDDEYPSSHHHHRGVAPPGFLDT